MRQQRLTGRSGNLDQHRFEKPLTLQTAGGEPLQDPFEQDPLVSDVLVNDRNALLIDRNDEGVAELTEGDERTEERRRTYRTCRSGCER
jgi:hypothetical protein